MVAIARVLPVACALLALLARGTPLLSQESDIDAVKRVVSGESDAFFRHDSTAWKSFHVQGSNAASMGGASGGSGTSVGWDAWGPGVIAEMKSNPKPIEINFDGGLAFAEYDQQYAFAPDTVFRVSRQHRVLVRRDGDWKIVSGGSYHLGTFDASATSIESRLGGVASTLSAAKKTRDAIEVLRLNAQLFPNSARVQQDLGDAYATVGETVLAIRHYEQALSLDPKNDASKLALARLRVEAACEQGSLDGLKCHL